MGEVVSQPKDAMVKNAGDPEQVRKASEAEKFADLQDEADMVWLTSDERGVNVLRRIFVKCGLFKISFTGNSSTFFNEGMREVGLWLSDEVLKANPQAYLRAITKKEVKK